MSNSVTGEGPSLAKAFEDTIDAMTEPAPIVSHDPSLLAMTQGAGIIGRTIAKEDEEDEDEDEMPRRRGRRTA